MLTDEEINNFWFTLGGDFVSFARDIERAVLEKAMPIPKQEPVAYCREGDLDRQDFVAITDPHYLHTVKLYADPQPAQAIPGIKND